MRTNRLLSVCLMAALLSVQALAQTHSAKTVASNAKTKTKSQRYVELVAGNDILKGSGFGVLAVKVSGDTVASWNCKHRLIPASNMKLITTGTAIHRLGPDFRYTTKIAYSGTIKDGVLDGDIYIVGGGDPTTASKDSIATPRFFLFSQWKAFLDKAGIKKVNGSIIGDGRYFDGMNESSGWSYEDVGTADGTGGCGLNYYENTIDMKVNAGAKVGDDVTYSVTYPSMPWMKFACLGKTAPAGTGDEIYLYPYDITPYAEIRGSFAIDRKSRTEAFSNKFGAYTCAYNFCSYLKSKGIEVSEGPADIRLGRIRRDITSMEPGAWATRSDLLTVLGSTQSPTIKQIAKETNYRSDNFYAEMLMRTLGRQMHHSACYDSSQVAVKEVLKSIGADPAEVQIRDGSGLSRYNYISPEFFVKYLTAMMSSQYFGDYVETLAQPGCPHYTTRMQNEPESVKSRIHLKSGSMNGIRCFSGYIEPSKGSRSDVIVFSLMTNNALVGTSKVDPILDKIMAFLAAEN